jgi:hypothetical protein
MSDWPIFVLGLFVMSILATVVLLIARLEERERASQKFAGNGVASNSER